MSVKSNFISTRCPCSDTGHVTTPYKLLHYYLWSDKWY